jgi:hypothetical protein
MIDLHVVLYSYKNSGLLDVVERLMSTATVSIHVSLMDQHPLDRSQKFDKFTNLHYIHQFWDNIPGPTKFKMEKILDNTDIDAKYTLVMSDDCLLHNGWDADCIEFINGNNKVLVSGKGGKRASKVDNHFLKFTEEPSEGFSLTRVADRNFILGHTETFRMTGYPSDVKYYGEEEKISLKMYEKGVAIYSARSSLYEDLGERTIENLYCPFSKEHKYNTLIDDLNTDSGSEWLSFIGIEQPPLKLFYQVDDVEYDPNAFKMVDLGGERYIAHTKAIY